MACTYFFFPCLFLFKKNQFTIIIYYRRFFSLEIKESEDEDEQVFLFYFDNDNDQDSTKLKGKYVFTEAKTIKNESI